MGRGAGKPCLQTWMPDGPARRGAGFLGCTRNRRRASEGERAWRVQGAEQQQASVAETERADPVASRRGLNLKSSFVSPQSHSLLLNDLLATFFKQGKPFKTCVSE